MTKVACDGRNDYFETILDIDVICLRYFFELTDFNGETIFYGNHEFFADIIEGIKTFLLPVWDAIVTEEELQKTWTSKSGSWR